MIATHNIQNISISDDTFEMHIDGVYFSIPIILVSRKLKNASDNERNFFVVSPSGYGIHWPLIDEDLSVNALLKLSLQPSA